jgi:hypothetical protein
LEVAKKAIDPDNLNNKLASGVLMKGVSELWLSKTDPANFNSEIAE